MPSNMVARGRPEPSGDLSAVALNAHRSPLYAMPDTSVDIDALLREALDDFDAAAGSSRGIGTSSSRSSSFPLHNSCTLSTAHTPLVVSAGILSPAELSLSYSDEIPTISPSLGCNNAAEYIASASRDDGCPMRLHRSVSRKVRAAPSLCSACAWC